MIGFFILAVAWNLVWDDPDNPVGTVAGYNVYRVEHLGTGEMIRHKVNLELIPWVPDTESTPSLKMTGFAVRPGDEFHGTAVGTMPAPGADNESPISDDFYRVPSPPEPPPALTARTTNESDAPALP